jgi:uncharacterized protein
MTSWLVLAMLSITLGAFVQSALGLGFALLAAPVLLLWVQPHASVVAVLALGMLSTGLVLTPHLRRAPATELQGVVVPLLVGAVLGAPLGALALRTSDVDSVRLVVGILIAVSGGLIVVAPSRPVRAERRGAFVAGFASGLLGGATGIGGPPAALYLSNQSWTGSSFRLALTATFGVTCASALVTLLVLGAITWGEVSLTLLFCPAVLVGWTLNEITSPRLHLHESARFKMAVGLLVLAAGAGTVIRSQL